MSQPLKVGVIGAGWPGAAQARGYQGAGGFKIAGICDLIPARRARFVQEFASAREFSDTESLLSDPGIDVVSICLPNHLHAPTTIAALKRGKHVVCEKPPAMSASEARKIQAAAEKAGRLVLYALQRRFGGAEQAARQAIARGYTGSVYHARASWMRTRGIPIGTGWFIDKSKSGGGALIDIGVHMLDISWFLLGQPRPLSVMGAVHQKFGALVGGDRKFDVDDSAFALIRFEGDKSLELSTSWALNQPPQQEGTLCRIHGEEGAIDVYSPGGATIYRNFDKHGKCKPQALKPPKTTGHVAMMRHLRACIAGTEKPLCGAAEGVVLMEMLDAIYKSAETGKSVSLAERR